MRKPFDLYILSLLMVVYFTKISSKLNKYMFLCIFPFFACLKQNRFLPYTTDTTSRLSIFTGPIYLTISISRAIIYDKRVTISDDFKKFLKYRYVIWLSLFAISILDVFIFGNHDNLIQSYLIICDIALDLLIPNDKAMKDAFVDPRFP